MPKAAGYSERSRLDKLGVKPGMRICVLQLDDREFQRELKSRTTAISYKRAGQNTDLVFLRVHKKGELRRLGTLQRSIKRNGAIWVLWTKGQSELKASDVRKAALESGLVDIKVAAFSEELSGLKLVIPVARR